MASFLRSIARSSPSPSTHLAAVARLSTPSSSSSSSSQPFSSSPSHSARTPEEREADRIQERMDEEEASGTIASSTPNLSILTRKTPSHPSLLSFLDSQGRLSARIDEEPNPFREPKPMRDTRGGVYEVKKDHPLWAFFDKDPHTGEADPFRKYVAREITSSEWLLFVLVLSCETLGKRRETPRGGQSKEA
jgi:hypothetical protein